MFDINMFDIIVIAGSLFGGYALPQPAWAKCISDLIKTTLGKPTKPVKTDEK